MPAVSASPNVVAAPRLLAAVEGIPRDPSNATLADLFAPLDSLLVSGGDPRIWLDPASRVNGYGCRPQPCPDTLSFASCTASPISKRAYRRAGEAREALMQSAIADGLEAAFDARFEAMREELRDCLKLSQADVEVVFSPSGTDAQLQALYLAKALLGAPLTSIVVAADQTGSGTVDTARGCHFSVATSGGSKVQKGEPIEGLAGGLSSVALALLENGNGRRPSPKSDAKVIRAVEKSLAKGGSVLLQIMDCSKLGWRAPSDQCLDEIARRWPARVQIVVDACQMRLGRPRLRNYLDRGYIVIVTGSKFFTGPAFSGALLVPAGLCGAIKRFEAAAGLGDYSSRSDWPVQWASLRSRFPVRTNFGQWLRWEAALEEIRSYYAVPSEFRHVALMSFGNAVERMIGSSRSLRLLSLRQEFRETGADDDELALPTIFPFVVRQAGRVFSAAACRTIYHALGRDLRAGMAGNAGRLPDITGSICQIGQPVILGKLNQEPAAALRICAGARLVTEAWSSDHDTAWRNLRREIDRVGTIVAKIEWLVAHSDAVERVEG